MLFFHSDRHDMIRHYLEINSKSCGLGDMPDMWTLALGYTDGLFGVIA